ncbi:LysR family transcriptional regulator [Streptomyces sp. CB01881]|uniref:LysR family transcriptional regulator n=1 Tax=Streptomyces sp. CB01881 TaxID=2078691 RepID=UPI000CDC78F8|nr:LysR family transcriptional regulator [Streptomyces sp. CB01881]AUY51102.1 LysR family transcriptional regulator [Streptomyces sp. CB01881]TYC74485.1 LysR family transcriptional regulator [Streptomyces sp. CB01881]
MPADLHPRLLRGFVATAETLHFGRAAERLHVAQQALSRDVRALERLLGDALFTRTTRSVELTGAGLRLLPKARQLLALHDEIVTAAEHRPLLLDVNSNVTGPDLTSDRLLGPARAAWPEGDILARYLGGLAAAAEELLAHRLDASLGRFAGLDARVRGQLAQTPVRLERVSVMMAAAHPLAGRPVLRLAELAGHPVDICAGNPATTEWADLGIRLLREHGLKAAAPYVPPVGVDETARYLTRHGDPMLTTTSGPLLPGVVNVPLVDPVPLSLVSLVHRPGLRHPGLTALRTVAGELGVREGWLRRPAGSWLPAADAVLLEAGTARSRT